MNRGHRLEKMAILAVWLVLALGFAQGEILYKIPVEHNHRSGECQGTLIVRDDKVVFESKNEGCGRVMEYASILRIETKHGYEMDIYFGDAEHGKDQKYVLKFKNDSPDNQAAFDYIMQRIGHGAPPPMAAPAGGEFSLPYRLNVELDLNGSNCQGTLVLREDKILFETGATQCSDRAFVREWDALKSYERVGETEFLIVFYKYGSTAPGKITRLRFWSKGGPVPAEFERYLRQRAH